MCTEDWYTYFILLNYFLDILGKKSNGKAKDTSEYNVQIFASVT